MTENKDDGATTTVASAGTVSSKVELNVRLSGSRFKIEVDSVAASVLDVKKVIESIENIPSDRQRLVFKGRILDDERTLSDYNIVTESTLFLVKSSGPTTTSTARTGASSSSGTTGTGTGNATAGNSTSSGAASAAEILGNMYNTQQQNSSSRPPQANMFNQQAQQQQPAGMMGDMMNSPMFDSLMSNPTFLQSIMERQMNDNPRMQQLLESNPELRQVMSDPNMMQQAMQMMRNPEYMQQAMRQQDLAMSQLENMPGGFSALSSMYRNVQEPMMEAQSGGNSNTDANNNLRPGSANLAGATGAAMPNPWSTNPTPSAPTPSTNLTPGTGGGGQSNPFAAMAQQMAGSGAGGQSNPFAAMAQQMGGSGASGQPNPFAAMAQQMGGQGASGQPNPFAAMAQQMGGQGASGQPNPFAAMAQQMGGQGASGQPNPFAAMAQQMGASGANPFGGSSGASSTPPNPWGSTGSSPSGGSGQPPSMPFPGMGGMGGQPPNLDQMMEMMNNPMISGMMNEFVQNNPDMLRGMIEQTNPQMAQMFGNNPQAMNDFIRTTMNPENMRNMINMQRTMGGAGGNGFGAGNNGGGNGFGAGNNAGGNGFGAGNNAGSPNGGLDFSNLINPSSTQQSQPFNFMNMLNNQFQSTGIQNGTSSGSPNTSGNTPQQQMHPADQYRSQLQSLADMGFDNEQLNLVALQGHRGNLNRAVDDLIAGNVSLPASSPSPTTGETTEEASNENIIKDSTEKKND